MSAVGDDVRLLAETLTDDGNVLDPETAPRGTIVGFQGLAMIVVSWHTQPAQTSVLPERDVQNLSEFRRR